MSGTRVEDLFDLFRFQEQQEFHKVLLYFPFGLLLLLFRLILGILIYPLLAFLPKSSKVRSFVSKGACLAFGIVVKHDDRNWDEKVKFLVSNHISVLDHIVVDCILPCRLVTNCVHSRDWNITAFFRDSETDSPRSEMSSSDISTLQKYVKGSDVAVLIFPEGAMTNGRAGLLKFITWPFSLNLQVQPVVIQVSYISFISISPSVIGTSAWYDLLWLLFVPYTVFTLRTLPSMEKLEKETVEEFSKRVQQVMASALNLAPTLYTAKDKSEYMKRLHSSSTSSVQSIHPREIQSNSSATEMNKMANQIKDILPNVPMGIILQDLGTTKCIDDTISRILEGVVQFTPECNSSNTVIKSASSADSVLPGPSSSTNSNIFCHSSLKCEAGVQIIPSLNTSVESFGKSPKERMLSYQERKAALIKASRIRYIQKHRMM